MRSNLLEVGQSWLLVVLCLFVIGFKVDAHQRKQRRIERRAKRGERDTLKAINDTLDLEQRLREERRP